jgi:L-threonylcarbamoyladenylate synthase
MIWVRPDALEEVADALKAGQIAVIPTETVYGLASTLVPDALLKVFHAKGRPEHKPLIVGVTGSEMAQQIVSEWPMQAEALACRFWPGPLSLVLPKAEFIPYLVSAGGPSVAVRAPSHKVAFDLIRLVGKPLVLTSANKSGRPVSVSATESVRQLGLEPAYVIDDGPTIGQMASTVYDVLNDTILRKGPISEQAIRNV